jgi:CRP-like cAMP-binding protein
MRSLGARWFARLASHEKTALLEATTRRKVTAGKVVLRRGDVAEEMFIVLAGKLKASVVNTSGRTTTFDIVETGDVFGEVGPFLRGLRTADVQALEPCELAVVRPADLRRAIGKEPGIAMALFHVMAERIEALSQEHQDAGLEAGTRFARSLVKLAERFGDLPLPGNLRVRLKLTQQELADLVGVSRVFANGRLRAWQRQGILTHRSGNLTIHDVGGLRRVAELEEVVDRTPVQQRP